MSWRCKSEKGNQQCQVTGDEGEVTKRSLVVVVVCTPGSKLFHLVFSPHKKPKGLREKRDQIALCMAFLGISENSPQLMVVVWLEAP